PTLFRSLPDPPESPLNPGDSMATRIMLVEDDQSLAMGLEFNLRSEGYAVDVFSDAESAQEALSREPVYDLILLDRMLPGKDGLTFLSDLRAAGRDTPVLLLTARDSQEDIVEGLDSGADDYLAKPFDLNVLLARVRSLLRRAERTPAAASDEARIGEAGEIHIDFNTLTAVVRGDTRRLTYKEAEILKLLWERRNHVVTREELLQK